MAKITYGIGAAFKIQAVAGTPEVFATDASLVLTGATAGGIVLPNPEGGIGDSGIDWGLSRNEAAVADVPFSFTKQAGTFIGTVIDKFSISVPMRGLGTVALSGLAANPVVDGDLDISVNYPGLYAILRAAGLVGAADPGATDAFILTPTACQIITAKLWLGSGANTVLHVVRDAICTKATLTFEGGSIAIGTFEFTGIRHSRTIVTAPSFNYQWAASIAPPVCESIAFSFGMGAQVRGVQGLTITIDNLTEEIEDATVLGGKSSRQTGRTIGLEATLYTSDTNADFEDEVLELTSAPTDDILFSVGSAVAPGGQVKSFTVAFNNPQLTKIEPVKYGPDMGSKITAVATSPSAGGEFALTFI